MPTAGGSGVVGRRKQQDPDTDSRRTRFFANRDAARGWISRWRCPEIEWPEVRDVPDPWIVLPADMETWLEIHVPRMNEYHWFIEGRPLAQGVTHAWARWSIGAEHAFDGADIELRTVADPPFLAETLALGADAAALDGWRPDDIHALHRWLLEGLDTRPLSHAVRGNKRTGFILFEVQRWPTMDNEVVAKLSMKPTITALDGSPLTPEGRTIPPTPS
jgi:hypothetical protein